MKQNLSRAIVFHAEGEQENSRVEGMRRRVLNRENGDVQYIEMKQMAEILERYRNRMRIMIQSYRAWAASYAKERDEMERTYSALEGIYLRRQLGDAWQIYCTVNKDYHELRRTYLANLRQPPHRRAVA